jgi:hypothetical protein
MIQAFPQQRLLVSTDLTVDVDVFLRLVACMEMYEKRIRFRGKNCRNVI